MASSSSASASSSASFRQPKHEVFLSFRGEDTRNNFLHHLYEAFRRKGVGAYADFKELPRGEEISRTLLQAIEESMISIIVFSQNYATSSWCLEELSKIMECRDSRRQLVVPIFYHISPSDIRKQTGSFGTAFVEHERNRIDKVRGWRLALTQAGSLSGFTLTGDESEPEVIEDIVLDIVNKLTWLSKSDYKGLIGIGPRMEQIKSLLCIGGEDVRIIGIWGMGGIGKTTLAQVLYDEVSDKFESHYFMANVREELGKHDAISLRDKLLSKLLNEESLHISTPMIGSIFIKDRLRRKRVLVVLDDVNDLTQLQKLLISRDHFGFGSRIIVTSRDKQVLTNVPIDGMYEVKELSYNDSLQHFCSFAFKQNHPAGDFKGLSNSFLEYAKGVPLALQVLGSALYKKDMADWESALEGIKQYLDPKIQDVLKISLDGLHESEKNIFLDIACFFKGYDRDYVTKILDGSHAGTARFRISNLIDKCLLNVTNGNELGMHDLIQEMGRNVVLAESPYPEERSRLWTQDDIRQVLENGGGTKSIQGMLLDQSQIGEVQLDPGAFAMMRHLRIIKFYGKGGKLVPLDPGLESLPNELRYFHWEYCMLKSLPSKFRPEKLVELSLHNSEVEQLWNGKQNLVNLRVLDLRCCNNLIRIPDLSAAINIETLLIEGCERLVELPSMIHMKSLRDELYIFGCNKLKKFPNLPQHIAYLSIEGTLIEEIPESISRLKSLVFLHMSSCRKLKSLPASICELKSLETLDLNDCSNFECLPKILKSTKCLIDLDLSQTAIEDVPSSISRLKSLLCLSMTDCTRIKSLPTSISELKSLGRLDLIGCSNFECFPETLKTMECLTHLHLSDCTKLKSLPESICELKSLARLDLIGCSNFECFPEILKTMECLTRLDLSGCTKLKSLPESICELKSLESLDLIGCSNFECFPETLKTMECLTHLYLSDCTKLKSLPESICELKSLARLDLKGCSNFECFPKILKTMECLTHLDLRGFTKLKSLPDSICEIKSLEILELRGCSNFECFPEILKTMECLTHLDLRGCTKLKSLPESICELKSLKRLDLKGCSNFECFPKILKTMECLTHLDLRGFTKLKSLPDSICELKSLELLDLRGCSNFECFPEILKTMDCLTHLDLSQTAIKVLFSSNIFGLGGGRNLSVPSSFCNLVSLTELRLSGSYIVEIPKGINQFSNLIALHLRSCKSLKSLPELPPFLRFLDAQGCTSLETVSKWEHFPYMKAPGCKYEFGYCQRFNCFMFNNCFNLDQHAIDNIVANGHLRLQCMAKEFPLDYYQGVFSCFPGSQVSEAFKNRSTSSSIIVQLSPPCSKKKVSGLALCVVFDLQHHHQCIYLRVKSKCGLKTECGDHHDFGEMWWPDPAIPFECKGFGSNHVILLFYGCDSEITLKFRRKYFDEALFEFYIEARDSKENTEQIKVQKCGVNFIYEDAVGSNDKEVESNTNYRCDGEEVVDLTNETLEPSCQANSSFTQDEENICDASMLDPNSAIDPYWLSLKCDVNNYKSDGDEAVDPTNATLEAGCHTNLSFIQNEENRCDASMLEPNSAIDPNWLSLKCDVNNYRSDGDEAVDPTNETSEAGCHTNLSYIRDEENRCDVSMLEPNSAIDPNWISMKCDVNNYGSDGDRAVDPTNETLEAGCHTNLSYIQDEESRCDASILEPNSAIDPNWLSLNCDVYNRDLEGSLMEEYANDEESLDD